MSDEDALLHVIRQKILAGELPREHCRMTWYGPGKGAICVACRLPITPQDIEVECDLTGGGTLRFHRRCYEIWSAAWPAMRGREAAAPLAWAPGTPLGLGRLPASDLSGRSATHTGTVLRSICRMLAFLPGHGLGTPDAEDGTCHLESARACP